MNPLSLLILISNMHQQLLDAQQENIQLREEIARLREPERSQPAG